MFHQWQFRKCGVLTIDTFGAPPLDHSLQWLVPARPLYRALATLQPPFIRQGCPQRLVGLRALTYVRWRCWIGLNVAAVERVPGKVSGAWVFKTTRVPVRALFENLEDGATVNDFLTWFPGVTREQVEAVLEHAERSLAAA